MDGNTAPDLLTTESCTTPFSAVCSVFVIAPLTEYFHSVWASILLHAFVNGFEEVLSLIPEAVTATWLGVICLAVIGVVLLFVAAKLYSPARKEPVAVQAEEKNTENELFMENSFDE